MIQKISRGDIYNIDLNPTRGSEQAGTRPCVIIQNDIGNEYSSTTIIVPCTTKIDKIYPTEVLLTARETGLDQDSKVKCDQIRTIDKRRLLKRKGRVPPDKIRLIDRALKISLGLEPIP